MMHVLAATEPWINNPLWIVGLGIATVLALMIFLKMNAFLALLLAALEVAWLSGKGPDVMAPVAEALGSTAGQIAIVIAMASIIGKCMLDSGAADRIVQAVLHVTGEARAAVGLMFSGFLLAVPVFFDTVFFLLVPLARSLYGQTGHSYLKYVMAICAGGACTHTLVPPTPGPLLVAANLGVDVGMMMLVGTMVAAPSSIAGLIFCSWIDRRMNIVPHADERNISEAQPEVKRIHPMPLWLALAPIALPVVLITAATLISSWANAQDRARLRADEIRDPAAMQAALREAATGEPTSALARLTQSKKTTATFRELLAQPTPWDSTQQAAVIEQINAALLDRSWFTEDAFRSVQISSGTRALLKADRERLQPAELRRVNRSLLEDALPGVFAPYQWTDTARRWADAWSLVGNANFSLVISALIALGMSAWACHRSRRQLAEDVEFGLLDAGMIILITSAGGAFGAMLRGAGVNEAIKQIFDLQTIQGPQLLIAAWGISAILKVAQGSSTVAMIVCSSIIVALVDVSSLSFHPAYLATAIGGGSLIGSWMNDSGFWVVAKMSGLTERQTLLSWTPLLIVLGTTALIASIAFAIVLPFTG